MTQPAHSHESVSEQAEEWRVCIRDGRYRISSLGRVRGARGGLLVPQIKNGRHLAVMIAGKQTYLHHLVAEAFLGLRPEGLWALHKNDDAANNAAENLYWGTRSTNMEDAYRNGRIQRGKNRRGGADMPLSSVAAIKGLAGIVSISALGRVFERDRAPIRAIQRGKNFAYVCALSKDDALDVYAAAQELQRRKDSFT